MTEQLRILALFGGAVLFGQERANVEALSALKERGHEVLCLVRDEEWSQAVPEFLEASGLACRKSTYIQHLPSRPIVLFLLRSLAAWIVANIRFLHVYREFRPTHIHAFNQLYVLNFLPMLALSRTPMIYRAGDKPVMHRALWRFVWRFVVARATHFVATSRFIASELVSHGVSRDRIEVIYSRPPRRPQVDRVSFRLPASCARNILFVGQITREKGPHVLVDAFRKVMDLHPSACLLIAGRISDWIGDEWARRLRDQVANDPVLGSRVHLLGFVENIPALLQQVEFLVVPSLCQEPLGLVVLEAKAASRPAIVFPSGGLPEMIEPGVDGIVCRDKSVDALAEALKCYLDNPLLAGHQGAAALASLDRLGTPHFAQSWSAVYEARR